MIFEDQQARKDLPCVADAIRPSLGFDLRMHAGFEATVPMKELARLSPATMTVLFRVTSDTNGDQPVYFTQRYNVPRIERTDGDARFRGEVDLGEGNYLMDWLMRGPDERFCSAHWVLNAHLSRGDKQVALSLPPGVIRPSRTELFAEQSRSAMGPLRVKVLVNFAPPQDELNLPGLEDQRALIAILRHIAREPRIGRLSLTAFNLRDQQVICRQPEGPWIDFPKLGQALLERPGGTVNVHQLARKNAPAELVRGLIADAGGAPPDALIIASSKADLDQDMDGDTLRALGSLPYPVFYLMYNPNPQQETWGDPLSKAVHILRGREYTIVHPRDVWAAWKDIMSRLAGAGQPVTATAAFGNSK